MAWEARSGLKLEDALQWHLWKGRRRQAYLEAQKSQGLGQVCLESRRCLLEDGYRQGLGRSKARIVGVITNLAMSTPRPVGDALALAMSGQATVVSHKAKGGLRRQPGKPGRRIGLKSEHALLGTDHHVVSLRSRLDER